MNLCFWRVEPAPRMLPPPAQTPMLIVRRVIDILEQNPEFMVTIRKHTAGLVLDVAGRPRIEPMHRVEAGLKDALVCVLDDSESGIFVHGETLIYRGQKAQTWLIKMKEVRGVRALLEGK